MASITTGVLRMSRKVHDRSAVSLGNRARPRRLTVALIALLVLVGCRSAQVHVPELTASLTVEPTAAAAPTAFPTETVALTATSSPLPSPTATATVEPPPTPTPTHPLMIEVMREVSYPGSDLVIEEMLSPGSNYDRYIVSYLSEGLKINALLTIPRGEKPVTGWPVVIFNHGYIPPEQYRTTERYVAYVDGFARSGYMVLRSDYRGHAFSEGEPSNAYGTPDYTVDVLNGLAAVKQHPDADPARIGMWGHSMGGTITLRAMVVSTDIRAGVIWAGVTAPYPELVERWRRRDAERPTPTPGAGLTARRWVEALGAFGTPEENPAFWDAIDPFSYLGEISGPVQSHHGTADTSVPVEYSEILHARLQAAGQVSEVFTYPNDNHNISGNFGLAMQRSIAFFDL